jgi:hypothetical protein
VPISQADVVAPPPPGFVDDTDQYYLPDDQGEDDRNSGELGISLFLEQVFRL